MRYSFYTMTALVFSGSASLLAQQPSRPSHQRSTPSCSEAVAGLRASGTGPEAEKSLRRLSSCGDVGYPVVADRIRSARVSRDTALLGGLNQFIRVSPKGGILDAILAVAADRSATTEARVSALATLAGELHRDMLVSYNRVRGGLNSAGMPVNGCFEGHLAGDYSASQFTQADVVRVRELAQTLRRDKTQPADVRSAATCVLS